MREIICLTSLSLLMVNVCVGNSLSTLDELGQAYLLHDVVCFLLGNSPVSEFYVPMFQNTPSIPSS